MRDPVLYRSMVRYIPGGEGGSAWAESLLALRARTLAKFGHGEVDTVPVNEIFFNKKLVKLPRKLIKNCTFAAGVIIFYA